jgi:hypothetical protein
MKLRKDASIHWGKKAEFTTLNKALRRSVQNGLVLLFHISNDISSDVATNAPGRGPVGDAGLSGNSGQLL